MSPGAAPTEPRLALVGATGAVGVVTVKVLEVRADVWGDIRLVSEDPRSSGTRAFRGENLPVHALSQECFEDVDIVLFDAGVAVSQRWAPLAAEAGCVVIDNSSAFRADPDVPLVVPQLNPAQAAHRPRGIIANPNSTVLTMIDALAVLHAHYELQNVFVATYQAASGRGQAGIDRLLEELRVVSADWRVGQISGDVRRLVEHELPEESVFPGPLALNVLPWVGDHVGDGWTSEECKIRDETRKILTLPDLPISSTCVRVPVVTGHTLAVHARFAQRVDVDEITQRFVEAPGLVVLDDPEAAEFPTPVDAVGIDPRFVGRIRRGMDDPHVLDFVICGDNLRKGAALNMVETAELVARELDARPS